MPFSCHRMLIVLSLLGFLFTNFLTPAQAEQKVFAEKKIVLQISDRDPFKQTLILNVANNLIRHYGVDELELEIVAFGPGLRLLFNDNANKKRIQSLMDSGVQFSACSNTFKAMTKKLGQPPELNPHAVKVSAGVVRILELKEQGYELIKP